jgi:NADH:ubiquinone oxidoreductase subunit K
MNAVVSNVAAAVIFATGVAGIALRRNKFQKLACCGLVFGAAAVEISSAGTGDCSGGGACFLTIAVTTVFCAAMTAALAALAAQAGAREKDGGN